MRQFNTPAGEVHALRFSPDGQSLYALSREVYHSRWMSDQLQWLPRLYQHAYRIDGRSGEIAGSWPFDASDVALFAPDLHSVYHSVSVAVAGGDFDLTQTNLLTGTSQGIRDLYVRGLSCAGLTPNGHIIAAGGCGEPVHRLDLWNNVELESIPTQAVCLAYSPDGRLLATGGSDGLHVWNGRRSVGSWVGDAWCLAWSPDELLAWGMNNRVAIARPAAEEPARVWAGTCGELFALTFSPDGRLLLAGTRSGQCAFHDAVAGQEHTAFDWGIGTIHSVAFSPDGLTCAAGGEKGRVVVWDVDS